MRDVFVSHVEEDAGIALELARGLEEAGYTTWYYERDSIPGPSYLLQTGAAVEACRAIVLVISPHSLGSNQVTAEVVRAHETGKPFIPVLAGIAHAEFQSRQPLWRQAVGSAASVAVPPQGARAIVPRLVAGLQALGIRPGEGEAEGAAPAAETFTLPRPAAPALRVTTGVKPLWANRNAVVGALGAVGVLALVGVVAIWLKFARPLRPIAQPTAGPGQPTAAFQAPTTAPISNQPTGVSSAPTAAPTLGPSVQASSPSGPLQLRQLAFLEQGAGRLAWSLDGQGLYIAGYDTGLYDVAAQQMTQDVQIQGAQRGAFSPDRRLFAAMGSDGVTLWDTGSWGMLWSLPGSGDTDGAAFSPDGRFLATATGDTVKVWEVAAQKELRTIPAQGLDTVAFSPDGRTLAVDGSSDVRLFDATTGQETGKLTGVATWASGVTFSPDGKLLAAGEIGEGKVRVWDVASGRQQRLFTAPASPANGLTFSPDGKLLAAGSGPSVLLWDLESGKLLTSLFGHTDSVQAVAFSPDGATLASGASSGEVRLWAVTQ